MSNFTEHDDDVRFDRLADGQLSTAEYRELLSSLDEEPSGWRRCALAFLEAQALETEIKAVRSDDFAAVDSAADSTVAAGKSTGRTGSAGVFRLALAMAACFLVAFGLGIALHAQWFGRSQSPVGDAPNVLAENSPPGAEANHSAGAALAVDAPTDSPDREPLRNVTLVVGDNEADAQRFDLPVVPYGDGGQEYLNTQRSAVPPQLRQMLERNGHRLRRSQRYVQLQMEDGRRVVVPVEEVEIVPEGFPAF